MQLGSPEVVEGDNVLWWKIQTFEGFCNKFLCMLAEWPIDFFCDIYVLLNIFLAFSLLGAIFIWSRNTNVSFGKMSFSFLLGIFTHLVESLRNLETLKLFVW